MDAQSRVTLHQLFVRIERERASYDALYEFMTTPDYSFRLRVARSLEKYFREEWSSELSNTEHTDFARMLNSAFAIACDTQESLLSRNVQFLLLMFALATDAKVAQYFCQVPPHDPEASDVSRCDRLAYTHFSAALLEFVESLVIKKEDTPDTFINKCLLHYTALLPACPPDHVNRPSMPRIRPPM